MTSKLAGWLLLVVIVIVGGCIGTAAWLSHRDKNSPPIEKQNTAQTLLQKSDDRTCGLPSGSTVAAVERVILDSSTITPPSVTIKVGQTVRWHNQDSQVHSIGSITYPASQTCNGFESGDIASGQDFAFTFTKPGTWKYQDSVNQSLPAEVVVTE